MIQIIEIPTEQTTAFTDLLLFFLAATSAILVTQKGRRTEARKALIWTWVFILLAIAALFGAVAHGFKMSENTNWLLWQPLNLALGLSVSLFAAGALLDLGNGSMPRSRVVILVVLGIVFYALTLMIPGSFLVFILYEAVIMLFALTVYIILAMRRKLTGAWWMVAGILISIIAAAIQSSGTVRLNLVWSFDHNGIFHLVQMVGIVVLLNGLLMDFKSHMGTASR